MRKIISVLTALSAAFALAACAKTEAPSESEVLSDPFMESSIPQSEEFSEIISENSPEQSQTIADDNPTRALCHLLSHGGAKTRFGYDDEPYEYNGSPITLPVTITASEDNLTEWSVGILCNINGVMQRLSSGDQVDKTMIIKEDLSPGETITFDVTFDPVVSVEDADSEKIMIAFLTTYNPTFRAAEEYIAYAGNEVHVSTCGPLNMNARPANIVNPITDSSFSEKIYNSDRRFLPSFYRDKPEKIISYLNINSDKSLDFNVTASHLNEGTYYAFILQNNEIVTFNGGKEYMKINAKEKYEYDLDFHLDKAECGDAVECVFYQLRNFGDDYDIAYILQTTRACLVVREDFSI